MNCSDVVIAGTKQSTRQALIDLLAEKGDKLMKIYDRSKSSSNTTRKVAKATSTKAKDIARSTSNSLRNIKQDSFANVKDTAANIKDTAQLSYSEMQKSIKQGWNKTRAWLTVGAAIAVTFAQKNMRKAQERLEKAQKNLQKMQEPLQSNVRSGLAKTTNVIGQSTTRAVSGIQQATTRAKELQNSWQEQAAQRQRKRKRAKMLFRWGIICGVALALLYSPTKGSEVRQRIGKGWRQSSDFFRSLNRNVAVSA